MATRRTVKVRIVLQPRDDIAGSQVYRVGQVYDLVPAVAEYLVAEGFAIIEMRNDNNLPTFTGPDRRRRITDIIAKHREGKKIRHE